MTCQTAREAQPSNQTGERPAKVLLYQSIGFLSIILLCLFDELLGLSSLVLGDNSYIVDLRDFTIKTLLVLCVWLLVSGSTRRMLAQAEHLAKFMKVCAWCRRIQHQGCWMPIERFLGLSFDSTTSHGICEDCMLKAQAEISASKQSKDGPRASEGGIQGTVLP